MAGTRAWKAKGTGYADYEAYGDAGGSGPDVELSLLGTGRVRAVGGYNRRMVKRQKESRHVALLRGVNVGGKNLLPMKDLAELFITAGCSSVRTYIQSGNVVVSADEDKLDVIAEAVTDRILERFGHRPAILWRSAEQLDETIRSNPFPQAVDSNALHVLFLSGLPDPRAIGSLDPQRSPPDAFAVRGRDIYLYLPNGMGRTKLTNAYFDSKLKISSTARNWRTVLKLFEMMKGD